SIVAPTRRALHDQLAAAINDLRVRPDGRRLGLRILKPTFLRVPRPVIWGYTHLLVDLLPAHVRAGFGFAEQQPVVARAVVAGAGIALPRLPMRLRRRRLEPRG